MTDLERILAFSVMAAMSINVGIVVAVSQPITNCTQQRLNASAIAGADRLYEQLRLEGKLNQ